jgi:hypothetical protein
MSELSEMSERNLMNKFKGLVAFWVAEPGEEAERTSMNWQAEGHRFEYGSVKVVVWWRQLRSL